MKKKPLVTKMEMIVIIILLASVAIASNPTGAFLHDFFYSFLKSIFGAERQQIVTTTTIVEKRFGIVESDINKVKEFNSELIKNVNYTQREIRQQKQALVKIQEIANIRKKNLINIAEKDPQAFLGLVLPSNIRRNMPREISDDIESEVILEGTVSVIHQDDFENKISKNFYTLRTVKGEFSLYTPKQFKNIFSNTKIKVEGIKIGNKIVVPEPENQLNILSAEPQNTTGEKKVLAIMVNFTNSTDNNDVYGIPITAERINAAMFTDADSMDRIYQESSFNQINFSGDVVGWYTIPYNTTSYCYPEEWSIAANEVAMVDGVNLSNYDYIAYIFPYRCWAVAIAELGGRRSWYLGYIGSFFFSHETGHNLGMNHASSISCGNKSIDTYSNCNVSEYGDSYDFMGNTQGYYQPNAPHKVAMGWIQSTQIQSVAIDGTYTITPLELAGSGIQALKINKPYGGEYYPDYPDINISQYYYISYRQPIGFDINLPDGTTRGASIHIWRLSFQTVPLQTWFIDTTPEGIGKWSDFSNAALADNAIFYDEINNITITQVSHDANSVTVSIKFGYTVPTTSTTTTTSTTSTTTSSSTTTTTIKEITTTTTKLSGTCPAACKALGYRIGACFVRCALGESDIGQDDCRRFYKCCCSGKATTTTTLPPISTTTTTYPQKTTTTTTYPQKTTTTTTYPQKTTTTTTYPQKTTTTTTLSARSATLVFDINRTRILTERERLTITIDGRSYDVTLNGVSDADTVAITVGNETKSIDKSRTAKIGDLYIYVQDVFFYGSTRTDNQARIVIMSSKETKTLKEKESITLTFNEKSYYVTLNGISDADTIVLTVEYETGIMDLGTTWYTGGLYIHLLSVVL